MWDDEGEVDYRYSRRKSLQWWYKWKPPHPCGHKSKGANQSISCSSPTVRLRSQSYPCADPLISCSSCCRVTGHGGGKEEDHSLLLCCPDVLASVNIPKPFVTTSSSSFSSSTSSTLVSPNSMLLAEEETERNYHYHHNRAGKTHKRDISFSLNVTPSIAAVTTSATTAITSVTTTSVTSATSFVTTAATSPIITNTTAATATIAASTATTILSAASTTTAAISTAAATANFATMANTTATSIATTTVTTTAHTTAATSTSTADTTANTFTTSATTSTTNITAAAATSSTSTSATSTTMCNPITSVTSTTTTTNAASTVTPATASISATASTSASFTSATSSTTTTSATSTTTADISNNFLMRGALGSMITTERMTMYDCCQREGRNAERIAPLCSSFSFSSSSLSSLSSSYNYHLSSVETTEEEGKDFGNFVVCRSEGEGNETKEDQEERRRIYKRGFINNNNPSSSSSSYSSSSSSYSSSSSSSSSSYSSVGMLYCSRIRLSEAEEVEDKKRQRQITDISPHILKSTFGTRQFEFHPTRRDFLLAGHKNGKISIVDYTRDICVARQTLSDCPVLGLSWYNFHPEFSICGASTSGAVAIVRWQEEEEEEDEDEEEGGEFDTEEAIQFSKVNRRNSTFGAFSRRQGLKKDFVSLDIACVCKPFEQLSSVSLNCTDDFFMTSGFANDVALYDAVTGRYVESFQQLHNGFINILRFSHHSPHVFATASFDHTCKVWDLRQRLRGSASVRCFRSSDMNVMCAFSPDDKFLLSSGVDTELHQYSLPTFKEFPSSIHVPAVASGTNFRRSLYLSTSRQFVTAGTKESFFRLIRVDGTDLGIVDFKGLLCDSSSSNASSSSNSSSSSHSSSSSSSAPSIRRQSSSSAVSLRSSSLLPSRHNHHLSFRRYFSPLTGERDDRATSSRLLWCLRNLLHQVRNRLLTPSSLCLISETTTAIANTSSSSPLSPPHPSFLSSLSSSSTSSTFSSHVANSSIRYDQRTVQRRLQRRRSSLTSASSVNTNDDETHFGLSSQVSSFYNSSSSLSRQILLDRIRRILGVTAASAAVPSRQTFSSLSTASVPMWERRREYESNRPFYALRREERNRSERGRFDIFSAREGRRSDDGRRGRLTRREDESEEEEEESHNERRRIRSRNFQFLTNISDNFSIRDEDEDDDDNNNEYEDEGQGGRNSEGRRRRRENSRREEEEEREIRQRTQVISALHRWFGFQSSSPSSIPSPLVHSHHHPLTSWTNRGAGEVYSSSTSTPEYLDEMSNPEGEEQKEVEYVQSLRGHPSRTRVLAALLSTQGNSPEESHESYVTMVSLRNGLDEGIEDEEYEKWRKHRLRTSENEEDEEEEARRRTTYARLVGA